VISHELRAGRCVIFPFAHLAISASPEEQLQCARIFVSNDVPASTPFGGVSYRHQRIRIAYLSADFYEHATAFLMAGVFEHHDKGRFETYAFSYGANDRSATRARLERAFDRFFDVSAESDAATAALLREHQIDIAIDLKGYTGSARPGILALRPAPVQVHYLGYPGTMGTDCIDYLIADTIVIPDDERKFYAEQIAYLPDTYQCNDRKRPLPVHVPSRAEAGLPAKGFVFCCFNANHKILPDTFDIWMRLLKDIPGSVLWLFADNDEAIPNLRSEARARGVAQDRLIFAKRASLEEHLARLAMADLVLDTLPYGAHTTASDALWAGVPVLTARGSTFAGRVAASLLSAAGMAELITSSPSEYEARARGLAADPAALTALRAKLARNRDTSPLFDTERITRQLEAAYSAMWQRYRRGEAPASFSLNPDGTPRFA
jgi:protein O-GlcNAc transferase